MLRLMQVTRQERKAWVRDY